MKKVHLLPFSGKLSLLVFDLSIKLEIFKFKIELVLEKFFDTLWVDLVEFGNQTCGDESVFESKSRLFAMSKNQLVQVVENKLEGLGVFLEDLYDLTDAGSVEWFVFDIAEVTKNLLDFLLHWLYIFN